MYREGFERGSLRRHKTKAVFHARLGQAAFDDDQCVFRVVFAKGDHLSDFFGSDGARGVHVRGTPCFGEVEGEEIDQGVVLGLGDVGDGDDAGAFESWSDPTIRA